MANRRPLIINGAQVGNLEVGDALVTPAGVPYSTVSTFVGLSDVPNSYAGQAGKFLRVNLTATGLDFTTGGGGGDVLPITQIAYGTGTGIDSSPDLSYDVTNGQFTLTPSPKETPGNVIILGTPSLQFVLPATAGGLAAIFSTPSFSAYLTFTLATPLVDGTEPTGFTNDGTLYTADIATDDFLNGPQFYSVSIAGSDAQTFNDLINQLNQVGLGIGFSANAIVDNFSNPPIFNNSGALVLFTNVNGDPPASITYTDTGANPLFGSLAAPYNVTSAVATPGTPGQSTFFLTDPTGLSNDATIYSETFHVDGGGPVVVSFSGSAAQTLGALFTQIATQLSSTFTFDGFSQFTINSPTTGTTSTVTTDATGFFSNPFVYPPSFITGFFFTSPFSGTDPAPTENAPGFIQIASGNGDQTSSGGDLTVVAGAGGITNGFGGSVFVTGGFSATSGGGGVFLQTGQSMGQNTQRSSLSMAGGDPSGPGGNVTMNMGSALAGSAREGGSFQLHAGNGDGAGFGGSIAITAGSGGVDNLDVGFIELLCGAFGGGSTIVIDGNYSGYPISHPISRGKDIIIAPTASQSNPGENSGRLVTHTNSYIRENDFTRIYTVGGSTGVFTNNDGNEITSDANCGSVIFEGHFTGHQNGSPGQFPLAIIIRGSYFNGDMVRFDKTYFGPMVNILSADATPGAQFILVDGDQTAMFNSNSLGAAWVAFTGTANDTQVAGGGPGVYNTLAVTYDLTTNKTTINIDDTGPFPSPLAVSQGNLGRVGVDSTVYYDIDVSVDDSIPGNTILRFTSIFSEVPNPTWIGRVVLTAYPADCGT